MKPKKVLFFVIILLAVAGCGADRQPILSPTPTVNQQQPIITDSVSLPALSDDGLHTAPLETPLQTQEYNDICYISGDGVRVRAQANVDSQILCSLSYGTQLTKTQEVQGWSKVKYGDISGYVRNDYLSDTEPKPRESVPSKLNNPKIVVKKSLRLLELWDGDSLVGSYPVGLGFSPEGHKQKEGDGKTPEGEYYVCSRNSNSNFYLSLGLSYPNKQDAQDALDDGRIDRRTYERIKTKIESKEKPSWDTPLGGEIMIHGHGSDRDWTAGCVAVNDDIMDILWAVCPRGTPVLILP